MEEQCSQHALIAAAVATAVTLSACTKGNTSGMDMGADWLIFEQAER